jgi:hypothetical protein
MLGVSCHSQLRKRASINLTTYLALVLLAFASQIILYFDGAFIP